MPNPLTSFVQWPIFENDIHFRTVGVTVTCRPLSAYSCFNNMDQPIEKKTSTTYYGVATPSSLTLSVSAVLLDGDLKFECQLTEDGDNVELQNVQLGDLSHPYCKVKYASLYNTTLSANDSTLELDINIWYPYSKMYDGQLYLADVAAKLVLAKVSLPKPINPPFAGVKL